MALALARLSPISLNDKSDWLSVKSIFIVPASRLEYVPQKFNCWNHNAQVHILVMFKGWAFGLLVELMKS